jgi:hypothetical protein
MNSRSVDRIYYHFSYTSSLNYKEIQAVPALLLLIYTLQFTVANALGFLWFH